jgi:hypothetical protein
MKKIISTSYFLMLICSIKLVGQSNSNVGLDIKCKGQTSEYCQKVKNYTLASVVLRYPSFTFFEHIDTTKIDYEVDFNLVLNNSTASMLATVDGFPSIIEFAEYQSITLKIDKVLDKIMGYVKASQTISNNAKKVGLIVTSYEDAKSELAAIIEKIKNNFSATNVNLIPLLSVINLKESTVEDIITKNKLDALVTLRLDQDRAKLSPDLFIKDSNTKIPLFQSVYNPRIASISYQLTDAFNFLIDEKGEWKTINLNTILAEMQKEDNLLKRATQYYNNKQYFIASSLLNKLFFLSTQESSDYDENLSLIVRILIEKQKYNDARLYLNHASHSTDDLRYLRAILDFSQGYYFKAYNKFDSLIKYSDNKTIPRVQKIREYFANTLIELDSASKAVIILEPLVNDNPSDSAFRYNLGRAYFRAANYDKAITQLKKLDSSFLNTKYFLSSSYATIGRKETDSDSAISKFHKSLSYNKSESVYEELIRAYNKKGQYLKADSIIGKVGWKTDEIYYRETADLLMIYDNIKENEKEPSTLVLLNAKKYINKYLERHSGEAKGNWLRGSLAVSELDFVNGKFYIEKAYKIDTLNPKYALDLMEVSILNNEYQYSIDLCNKFISRFKKVKNPRNIMLSLYLKSVAIIAMGDTNGNSKSELQATLKELDNKLKTGGKIFDWYFGSFKQWAKKQNFKGKDTLAEITKLTEKMENTSKSNL